MTDSLFEINRYDPEQDESKQENVLLENINKRIKEKRKLDNNSNKEISNENEPVKKKRKKNKKKNDKNISADGFTILGEPTDQKIKTVNRVLPLWLAQPNILTVDLLSSTLAVEDMPGLSDKLVSKLAKEGITKFFPVQQQVIPKLLDVNSKYRPNDLCVSAPTGSGKTLAFVLPIVQSLTERLVPRVRAVAVLPTQDLASQVYKVFVTFCEGTGLRVKLLTGGEAVVGEDQLVRKGVVGTIHQLYDILVVTPGRLVHTIRAVPSLDLTHLRYLVIDEADRMMDNISEDWLNVLENAVYSKDRSRPGPLTVANMLKRELPLQKLLFSATLSTDPEQLQQMNLFEPKLYQCQIPAPGKKVQDASLPTGLRQLYVSCQLSLKPAIVHHVIADLNLNKALVFTHSNESAHRLSLILNELGYRVGELSSLVKDRKKLLAKFARGEIDLLVCSDVMARGIDLEGLDGVILYDVPAYVKTYIHRVGRTARAGKEGLSVTLCEEKQVKNFLKMVKESGIEVNEHSIPDDAIVSFKEELSTCIEAVKTILQNEKEKSKEGKKSKNMIDT